MAMIVRRTAKLNQCDNIVSTSSFGLPAALMALSDIPLDSSILAVILRLSRAARNEIGPQPLPFAAKSSGLSASRACNLLLRVHRGMPRTAVVAKATTFAAGRIECGINLDIPTEAVVTVNPLIGAPRRRSAHLNFNDRRNSMMHSAIDIHALTRMLAHSNQILPPQ